MEFVENIEEEGINSICSLLQALSFIELLKCLMVEGIIKRLIFGRLEFYSTRLLLVKLHSNLNITVKLSVTFKIQKYHFHLFLKIILLSWKYWFRSYWAKIHLKDQQHYNAFEIAGFQTIPLRVDFIKNRLILKKIKKAWWVQ